MLTERVFNDERVEISVVDKLADTETRVLEDIRNVDETKLDPEVD